VRPRPGDAALLAAAGVGLGAVTEFAPFLYPYPLTSPLNPVYAGGAFVGDLLWAAAMMAAFWRDPRGALWKVVLFYRVVVAIGVLWVANTSLTWTLWQMSLGLTTVVFAHLVLAFPGGRLETRYDRALIYGAYSGLALIRVGWALTWDPSSADCFPRCQVNPFVIWPNDALGSILGPGVSLLIPVLAAAVIAGVLRHWRVASPAQRRALLPVVAVAPIELGLTAARYAAAIDQQTWEVVGVAISTSPLAFMQAAIPAGFLLGLAATRLARGAVAELAIELGRGVPLGSLRDRLAKALRDPTLELAFPAPSGRGFVDSGGHPVEMPAGDRSARRVTRLERDGETLAALIYDPAIEKEDPGRVQAVTSVASLALENERLAAQVQAQLKEVRASRARIVEAADAERRRIERDLHDGAQQRLVALAMRLDQARQTSQGAEELIDATTAELLTAVGEVRDLARGLHPAILGERGLAAAVEALAERAPIPVQTKLTEAPVSTEAAAAAYFLVTEALTNAARHAEASRVLVEIAVREGELVVTVSDDGRGGVEPARGTGLQGLSDRIETVGGTLSVDSPPGGGTTIRARLPLGPNP
jgi:signal transduction histidine kinase